MKPPTKNSAAWEQDSFWRDVVQVITEGKKLRSDHYLQNLSGEELEQLRFAFRASGTQEEQRQLAPKRRGGPLDGELPNSATFSELAKVVRQVTALHSCSAQDAISRAAKERCNELGLDPEQTNRVLRIVAEEALVQHDKNIVGNFAISAAQVLLAAESARTRAQQEEKKIGLRKAKLTQDDRKIILMEKKAEAYDRAQAALTAAKSSKGGITKETLAKIESELKLL